MLMAIDAKQRIVGATGATRSLLLDDRALLAGISLWTLFEQDSTFFGARTRPISDAIAGRRRSANWPALVTRRITPGAPRARQRTEICMRVRVWVGGNL